MLVEFKQDEDPLSYVNAFAKPVSRYSTQIVKDSTDRLAQEATRPCSMVKTVVGFFHIFNFRQIRK